jgi:hypothetical protein
MDTNKIDTPTLIVIVILMMSLINGMMSCTSSRPIYQQDQDGIVWKTGPKTSTVTGYPYK